MLKKSATFLEEILTSILMLALVLLTFLNVILRYFFSTSISGVVEISGLMFIWICLLGSSLALKYKGHIAVDIILNRLSEKSKPLYQLGINLVMIVTFAILVYYGVLLTIEAVHKTLGNTSLSQAYLYAALPVGFFIMLVRLIAEVKDTLRNRRAD